MKEQNYQDLLEKANTSYENRIQIAKTITSFLENPNTQRELLRLMLIKLKPGIYQNELFEASSNASQLHRSIICLGYQESNAARRMGNFKEGSSNLVVVRAKELVDPMRVSTFSDLYGKIDREFNGDPEMIRGVKNLLLDMYLHKYLLGFYNNEFGIPSVHDGVLVERLATKICKSRYIQQIIERQQSDIKPITYPENNNFRLIELAKEGNEFDRDYRLMKSELNVKPVDYSQAMPCNPSGLALGEAISQIQQPYGSK